MIDVDRYKKLKREYGKYSSWAIWQEAGEKPKSNTGDMSIFDDEKICDKLNDKFVFVGLNGSSTHGKQEAVPWKNFHSDYSGQNDFKLRFALKGTPFWGSYITDIIKNHLEVDSKKVREDLKSNYQEVEDNIKKFKKELSILSDKKPVLIAMGNDSYNILQSNLGDEYVIEKIMHYSYRISKENYREKVLSKLEYSLE